LDQTGARISQDNDAKAEKLRCCFHVFREVLTVNCDTTYRRFC